MNTLFHSLSSLSDAEVYLKRAQWNQSIESRTPSFNMHFYAFASAKLLCECGMAWMGPNDQVDNFKRLKIARKKNKTNLLKR